jgi:YfiR/HmsC-like
MGVLSPRGGLLVVLGLSASLLVARMATPQLPTRSGAGQPSLEYQVKAAYLLNFTRYVEWPARAFDSPEEPITICVLGEDPFGSVLDETLVGRSSQGRQARVQRIRTVAESEDCHLVFISRETWRDQPDLPRRLRAVGRLTVGETDEFAHQGGVIAFVIQNEAVRFVVNAEARDLAGLRISSRMLSLAAAVYGQRSGL